MTNSQEIEWKANGVPVSRRFADPYYSLDDGLAEARHVFLAGNHLADRLVDGFQIAELGFGTGLNLLAVLDLWRGLGRAGLIRYTSFEAFPLSAADMIRAQAAFPELAEIAAELTPFWEAGARSFDVPGLAFELITGDARATLPGWDGVADAWFLDGFAPAQNPEIWGEALLQSVAEKTRAGGSFATFTAAGAIRRGLDAAGFDVERVTGFGRKRHMSIGVKR